MHTSSKQGRRLLYLLVFLSGCAGLIYQVVWHKYLTILLGAQARATAVVLAIFLGGISAGYTYFGRWTRFRNWNLLRVYALVELGLGVWAFCFPYLFRLMLPFTSALYGKIGIGNILIDIFVSILLIGFPTFLMGGTLPLLTQGVSEDLEEASGTHAKIYGFNTVGACVGSVLAGYLLIPVLNLPLTVTVGGSLNILVALVSYFMFAKVWSREWNPEVVAAGAQEQHPGLSQRGAIIMAIGFLSGFYILTMETVLIRLMGLSTGASNYNFTLIVSIFVFGLGFGSLLVRRISQFSEAHLLWNQLGIAISMLLLYLSADSWPYWVHLVRIIFRDIDSAFYFYQLALGVLFLLMLVVPVGLCGLTLPYCFHLLKDRRETLGHRVGQLYGLNTIGCVMGAMVGGYFLLYFINLDQVFKVCIAMTLVSSALAGWLYSMRFKPSVVQVSLGSSLFTVGLVGLVMAPLFAKEHYIQPFRAQSPLAVDFDGADAFAKSLAPNTSYLVYKDGPNTSVGVGVAKPNGIEMSRTIFVNGKSDGNTRGDFFTMNLTGHIPALLAPKLDRVAVIGFGTGLTTGALARYTETKRVDVVDISGTVLENAHLFDKYNGGVSTNPKVHFNEMDAFRFLAGTPENFDLIVSEPSNPWVAGVENLFSQELYTLAKRKLNPGGVYVQWVQAYSFNDELFRMVLHTITSQFKNVSVFQMLEHDFLLVATEAPFTKEDLQRSAARFASNASAKRSIEEGGLNKFETILGLEVIPSSLTAQLGEGVGLHKLETPRLSNGATRAFFVGASAKVHSLRREMKEFFPSIRQSMLSTYFGPQGPPLPVVEEMRVAFCENQFAKSRILCEETLMMSKFLNPVSSVDVVYEGILPKQEFRGIASFQPGPEAKNFSDGDLVQVQKMFDLFKKYYSPIARIPADPMMKRIESCLTLVPRTKDLYGDCLLQKSAILEIVQPEAPEFRTSMTQFTEWFTKLSPESQSYTRFKQANEILERVIRENDAKASKG